MSKYRAKKTVVDGVTFDSRKEAQRYMVLRKLEQEHQIAMLELQPRFLLQEAFRYNGQAIRKIEYVADFKYIDLARGQVVVEDVKGMKTEAYKIKKKLFLRQYGDNVIFAEL